MGKMKRGDLRRELPPLPAELEAKIGEARLVVGENHTGVVDLGEAAEALAELRKWTEGQHGKSDKTLRSRSDDHGDRSGAT